MPYVLLIQDKPETIWDNEQFARMLDEKLGSDAAEFFRDAVYDANMNPNKSICSGECDRVYKTQEHYEATLKEVRDELMAWPMRKLSKVQLEERRNALVVTLNNRL